MLSLKSLTIVHILKKMWFNIIAPILMSEMAANQGDFGRDQVQEDSVQLCINSRTIVLN